MRFIQIYPLLFHLFFIQNVVSTDTETLIVETIPDELTYDDKINSTSTYDGILSIVKSAKNTIEIASMYWTMLGTDVMKDPVPESKKGEEILQAVIDASKIRSVKVRIAVNAENNLQENEDIKMLKEYAQIRAVNFTRLIGAGVLHTKFIIADGKHFYLGSANMDWRSLTHVKEMGVIMKNNEQVAEDLQKIFNVYWFLGDENSVIPKEWPSEFDTDINSTNPLKMEINPNSGYYGLYLSSSPREFCPSKRTNDLDAILDIINEAEHYIYIAIMDYFPEFLYTRKHYYWPLIDNALRRAVTERRVNVRLMASHWSHTRKSLNLFLKSLSALNGNKHAIPGSIQTKFFTFPNFQTNIPFSNVNHNKYMVTDKSVYIGTSNWSADYFVNTAGVGLILNTIDPQHSSFHNQMKNIFLRDWNSKYAKYVY